MREGGEQGGAQLLVLLERRCLDRILDKQRAVDRDGGLLQDEVERGSRSGEMVIAGSAGSMPQRPLPARGDERAKLEAHIGQRAGSPAGGLGLVEGQRAALVSPGLSSSIGGTPPKGSVRHLPAASSRRIAPLASGACRWSPPEGFRRRRRRPTICATIHRSIAWCAHCRERFAPGRARVPPEAGQHRYGQKRSAARRIPAARRSKTRSAAR